MKYNVRANAGFTEAYKSLPYRMYLGVVEGACFKCNAYLELCYVAKGTLCAVSGSGKRNYKKGDIAIFNPHEAHCYFSLEENALIFLQIEESYLKRTYDLQGAELIDEKLADEEVAASLEIAFAKMLSAYTHDELSSEIAYELLDNILVIIFSNLMKRDSSSFIKDESTRETVYGIIDEIVENSGCDTSLVNMADRYNISSSYLSRCFKKVTGVGYPFFVSLLRLDKASEIMISKSDMNITETALASGFLTPKSMNVAFREILDLTPSEYRESVVKFGINRKTADDLLNSEEIRELKGKVTRIRSSSDAYEDDEADTHVYEIDGISSGKIQSKVWNSIFDFDFCENGLDEGINRVKQDLGFKTVRLRFVSANGEIYVRSDRTGNIKITRKYLNRLIVVLSRFGVRPVLSLDPLYYIKSWKNLRDEELLSLMRTICKDFLEIIAKHVGRTVMSGWFYEIDFTTGLETAKESGEFSIIYRFYRELLDTLIEFFEDGSFGYGVHLGKMSLENKDLNLSHLNQLLHRGRYPISIGIDVVSIMDDFRTQRRSEILNEYAAFLDNCRRVVSDMVLHYGLPVPKIYVGRCYHGFDLGKRFEEWKDIFYTCTMMENILFYFAQGIGGVGHIFTDMSSEDELGILSMESEPEYGNFLNYWGLKTQRYRALKFASKLFNEVIYSSHSCVATKRGADYSIIICDSVDRAGNYVRNCDDELISYRYKNMIKLSGIHGQYKMRIKVLDKESGSLMHAWQNLGDVQFLELEDIEYLASATEAKVKMKLINLNGNFEYELKMSPFSVYLIELIKV